MTRCKVNDEFQFPESIDMAPYTLNYLSQPERPVETDVFELVGVLVHSGTAESGHYYSFIRQRPSLLGVKDSWVQFNDSDVTIFDPTRIQECCFGGFDSSISVHFPKIYNAYMLFYQRRSSIRQFEAHYIHPGATNPIRLPLLPSRESHIAQANELCVRAYCAQDRSHAKFMRLLLERTKWGEWNSCSESHSSESSVIPLVLEYVQQISCRFKDLPEVSSTMRLLSDRAIQCVRCANDVLWWFPRNFNFRDTVMRNPQAAIRKTFRELLLTSLISTKKTPKEEIISLHFSRQKMSYKEHLGKVIEAFQSIWPDIHKYGRAWNDYFESLQHIASWGFYETAFLLDRGLLEKVLEIIWVDGRSDPKRLRRHYLAFVALREKGRVFSYSGLVGFLATVLEKIDFSLDQYDDDERPRHGNLLGLVQNERDLLEPTHFQGVSSPIFEWLRRIIVASSNAAAISSIVGTLAADDGVTAMHLASTLTHGLASEYIHEATSFLEPALTFSSRCRNPSLVQRVVQQSLRDIESINSQNGKEHLDYVSALLVNENMSIGWNHKKFEEIVFRNSASWAPVLLLFPDNSSHHDVAAEAENLLNQYLIQPLVETDRASAEYSTLKARGRLLSRACYQYVQKEGYIPSEGRREPLATLEPQQTSHMEAVVHTLLNMLFTENAQDEAIAEQIREAMELLKARAQTALDTLSEGWQENESLAVSESENGDVAEFGVNEQPSP